MSPKRTFISIRISMEELKKINYLKNCTEANTKAAVLRKGLYSLYDQIKQRENSGVISTSPAEA